MNIEIEKAVGVNIRRARKSAGMTQEILSAKLQLEGCDITRSALAKIEVGERHLYVDELILIRRILDIDYENLLEIEKP